MNELQEAKRLLSALLECCELNMDDMEPETRELIGEVYYFLTGRQL